MVFNFLHVFLLELKLLLLLFPEKESFETYLFVIFKRTYRKFYALGKKVNKTIYSGNF